MMGHSSMSGVDTTLAKEYLWTGLRRPNGIDWPLNREMPMPSIALVSNTRKATAYQLTLKNL